MGEEAAPGALRVIGRLVPFIAATVGLTGCGQSHMPEQRLSVVAHKCHESEAAINGYVDGMLKAADRRGIHGSRGEAVAGLTTLTTYIEQHKQTVDCKLILSVLIASAEKPSTERVCRRYHGGRVCTVPPIKK
jgi:hypothetical protein